MFTFLSARDRGFAWVNICTFFLHIKKKYIKVNQFIFYLLAGMNFAQLQLKAALASILMNFEVKPKDSSEAMTLDPSQSFFTTPKGNLWLEFKKL
jgi:hypothetical protein